MFGDFLADSLAEHGVGTDYIVRTDAAKTALAFVALDASGERFSFYRPPAPTCCSVTATSKRVLRQRAVLPCLLNSLTEPAIAEATFAGMERARDAGAVVSLDLNLRPALWPANEDPTPRLWQALERADLVKLSRGLDYLAAPLGSDGRRRCCGACWPRRRAGSSSPTVRPRCTGTPATTTARSPVSAWPRSTPRLLAMPSSVACWLGCWSVAGPVQALQHSARTGGDHRHAAIRCRVGALAVTRKGAFAAMPSLDEVRSCCGTRTLPHEHLARFPFTRVPACAHRRHDGVLPPALHRSERRLLPLLP